MCGKTARMLQKATDEVLLHRLFLQSGRSGENVTGGADMEVAAKGKSAWQTSKQSLEVSS